MIEVKNLVKKYGNHVAVDGLTFSIDKGRVYGFLGPNGAGKTTTMNIITGYLAATKGSVTVNGYDILKKPEEFKKSVGYLPELPPVYMDMTVREYLLFTAELKGVPKKERQIQTEVIMSRVKLSHMADRLIANLSKGYRQRVGLAQAILGFPETIILDEPMVGLDPQQIIEIRQLIRSLAKNHTVILSSHILAEVRELCDYIPVSYTHLYNRQRGMHIRGYSELAQKMLLNYSWPGNIRELRNVVEYGFNMAQGEELTMRELPDTLLYEKKQVSEAVKPELSASIPEPDGEHSLTEMVESFEKELIRQACRTAPSMTAAAEKLRISRQALSYKLSKYGLKK